jgi:CheY-like chemotaxis protein
MNGIYCIDDDPNITNILYFQLTSLLNGKSFCVEIINDPQSALQMLDGHVREGINPTLLIVDFQMPDIRGDELVRTIKERYPNIKVIMLSGNSSAILVSDLEEDGLLDFYIAKPWNKDELLEKVNLCLPLNLKFLL